MTVLSEGADSSAPPSKKIRLSCPSGTPKLKRVKHMATPIDAAPARHQVIKFLPGSASGLPKHQSSQTEPAVTISVMLNGYGGLVDTHKAHSPDDCSPNTEGISPVATLCNLGNTCFLNSVLYTLRFAPNFLHNLHHLATDLIELSGRYSNLKIKSSSLGRGIGGSSKNWSNKDLSIMGQGSTTSEDKIALTTLRLHELYEALHNAELKDHIEPYQPEVFLTALREVNIIFEGNQQHDAHELLVCLLDTIRETCRQLSQLSERQKSIIPQPPLPTCPLPPTKSSFSSNVRKSLKLGKKSNGNLDKKATTGDSSLICDQALSHNDEPAQVGHNFIADDFEGLMHLYTTCLECEKTSERPETFIDICVPVTPPSGSCVTADEISALYHSAIVTEEYLQDTNKYSCEDCGRLVEARQTVSFDTLPRLLILQLKRFSSSIGACVQKVNEFMPTPLVLGCFCKKCIDLDENRRPHRGYQLYGIIMHLGSTMASGHYVTYVCSRDTVIDCANCTRDKRKTASLSGGAGKPAPNTAVERHGLFRFFKTTKPSYSNTLDGRGAYYPPCRSADCCGVKMEASELRETWLECDDETIRTLSKKQLEELIGPKTSKNAALTPYLLFYSRIQ